MNATLKISTRGTLTLPREFCRRFVLKQDDMLIDETTDEGILLKPASVYPTGLYSESRLAEFERNNNAAIRKLFPILKKPRQKT